MSSQTCYWPNGGGVASEYTPCGNATTGQAACCAPGAYCFSNGLCLDSTEMTTYRGACTDKTWSDSACPQYCLKTTSGALYQSVCGVWACNNNNQFSCDYSTCGNSSQMFIINGGTLQRNAAVSSALSLSSSTSSATSSTSRASTTSTSAAAGTSTSTAALAAQANCPSHTGALAGIGVGLGIPLLLALLACAFLFTQLRKYKNRSTPTSTATYSQPSEQKHGYTQPFSSTPSDSHTNDYYSSTPAYRDALPNGNVELPPTGTLGSTRTELA